MDIYKHRKLILGASVVLAILSAFFATKIQFVFDLERFFPQGDDDLAFYYEFREEFEDDDNFLLIAFTDSTNIFNPELLAQVDSFTRKSMRFDQVRQVSSITNFKYFVKLQFGGFSPPYPAIKLDEPARLSSDSARLMMDKRIVGNLISKDATSTVVLIKTENSLTPEASTALMDNVQATLNEIGAENYHILGRAYLQTELVRQQTKEFIISTLISAILVSFVFWFILKRVIGVMIAVLSMLLSLLAFVGIIGFLGIELDLLSSLFPIIMIIVGVSDVVHLSNKYIDEYEKLGDKQAAIKKTVKEIGLATFLTSATTAIGFITLMTSRIYPVKSFGMTAAIGVLLAFGIVITFTTALLSVFDPEKVTARKEANKVWKEYLLKLYHFTKPRGKAITVGAIIYFVICMIGMSLITTDLRIYDTLPKGLKVTNDFRYFETNYAGFRPYELAVLAQEPYKVDDWEVMNEMNKIETYLAEQAAIDGVSSFTTVYKTMNRAFNADRSTSYTFPESEAKFNEMKRYVEKIPTSQMNVLVNEDLSKARISAKIKDVGSDQITAVSQEILAFIAAEIDSTVIKTRVTGTGVIFDKNNEYIRESLLSGLAIAFVAISLIMSLLFRNWRMVIVSLIPNIFPLLFGAALMGYFQIALDAPTAIIFAIAFGIAVDDTIHFLSKYKIERMNGKNMDEALQATFTETGKAIIITSIILFFGFLILLFSKTPGIVFVGVLVAGTLLSAVVADLLLIPLLIRVFMKERE